MLKNLKGLIAILTLCAGCWLPALAANTPAKSTVEADYVVGPGDVLQVFVWRNPELTVTVPVRPDGKISTPLVEDMVAVGKSPSQLARDIEKVLSEYVKSPQVNVIVTQPASVFSQVKVIGQEEAPGAALSRRYDGAGCNSGNRWFGAVRSRQSGQVVAHSGRQAEGIPNQAEPSAR